MMFLNGRQCRCDRRGTVARHQIEDLNLAGLQARQGLLEYPLQVLRFVAVKVSGVNPRGDAEPLGGAEITQHLFAASVAIVRARVDLVVAKFRDGAKHCVCGRSVMNPGPVSAVAERHGAEDDVSDRCFGHSKPPCVIEYGCTVTDFDRGDNRDKLRWRIQRIVTMYKSGLMELEAVVAIARRRD